jgi:hypothetical protein
MVALLVLAVQARNAGEPSPAYYQVQTCYQVQKVRPETWFNWVKPK